MRTTFLSILDSRALLTFLLRSEIEFRICQCSLEWGSIWSLSLSGLNFRSRRILAVDPRYVSNICLYHSQLQLWFTVKVVDTVVDTVVDMTTRPTIPLKSLDTLTPPSFWLVLKVNYAVYHVIEFSLTISSLNSITSSWVVGKTPPAKIRRPTPWCSIHP